MDPSTGLSRSFSSLGIGGWTKLVCKVSVGSGPEFFQSPRLGGAYCASGSKVDFRLGRLDFGGMAGATFCGGYIMSKFSLSNEAMILSRVVCGESNAAGIGR